MTDSRNSTPDAEISHDVEQIVESSNRFACDLYSLLARETDGNLFFSPSSLSLALAMTYAGANGTTAQEITEALHYSLPPEKLHTAFGKLQAATRTGGVELKIANRLWGQAGYHFLPEFLRTTKKHYGAGLAEVDFRNAPEVACQQINSWVEEQTAGKITDLVSSAGLHELTRLILTNAIYFLGTWENEFDRRRTTDAPFWTAPGKSQSVPMMRLTKHFHYGEFDQIQVLEMPYRSQQFEWKPVKHGDIEGWNPVEIPDSGSDFALCVLLPRKMDGLVDLERTLSPSIIQKWMTLQACKVDVSCPRFQLESSFQLEEALASMGIRKAFISDEADFSQMSDNPEGLFIGSVLHKAFVEVNEKGTEAAAATAVMMACWGAAEPEPPKEFRADHPFLFLIRDRRTLLIHFMGRVVTPSE